MSLVVPGQEIANVTILRVFPHLVGEHVQRQRVEYQCNTCGSKYIRTAGVVKTNSKPGGIGLCAFCREVARALPPGEYTYLRVLEHKVQEVSGVLRLVYSTETVCCGRKSTFLEASLYQRIKEGRESCGVCKWNSPGVLTMNDVMRMWKPPKSLEGL